MERDALRQALEKVQQAISAQEQLRAVLSEAELEAALKPLKERAASLQAQLTGSGAIAQGKRTMAVGAGGLGIQHLHGDAHFHAPGAAPLDVGSLREAYLERLMQHCGHLSLAGVDPGMAGQKEADTRLNLNAVYTALLTQSPRQDQKKGLGAQREPSTLTAEEERLAPALARLDAQKRLVLQGEPGSGKSTFVRFVALCLAGEALKRPEANLAQLTTPLPDEAGEDQKERQPWTHSALLPVVVILKDFAAKGLPESGKKGCAEHLWDFIAGELKTANLAEYAFVLKQHLLAQGGLLLFDGLDEVPEAEARREQVQQAVADFVRTYGRCRALVTSRTYAYQNQGWKLEDFAEAVLAPFSDGQVRRFIAHWYAHAAGLGHLSQEDAAGRAVLLQQAIFAQPRLRELAARPLLLTLMASLHAWRGGNLPERHERLYADTLDLLLDFWERRKVDRNEQGEIVLLAPGLAEWLRTDREAVRRVLEDVAFEAHRTQPELLGTADIPEDTLAGRLLRSSRRDKTNPAQLEHYLRERSGIIVPHGVGVYTFPHRSFQEYLAACYLTRDTYPDEVATLVRKDPDRWREVGLLAGAKAARGSAAAIWQLADTLCFRDPEDAAVETEDTWGAQLAGQALAESADLVQVNPAHHGKRKRIQHWLLRLLRSEDLPATERAIAGKSLAALGDPRFDPEHWYLSQEPLFGFVPISAGEFVMGSEEELEWFGASPQHRVFLPAYYLARWPVTVAQFRAFVEATDDDRGAPEALQGRPNHPVVNVTWYDAIAYCRWLDGQLRELASERLTQCAEDDTMARGLWTALVEGTLQATLPSEAEWEKAARGTEARRYPWGMEADPERANYNSTNIGTTSTVGCFSKGASPYGVEELSGNVWEWTRSLWGGEDWEKPSFGYPYDPTDGREDIKVPRNISRVLRGGAFDLNREYLRCVLRHWDGPNPPYYHGYYGFRVVLSPFSGR